MIHIVSSVTVLWASIVPHRAVYFRRLPWLLLFTLAELMGALSNTTLFEILGCDLLGIVLLLLSADITARAHDQRMTADPGPMTIALVQRQLERPRSVRVVDEHSRLKLSSRDVALAELSQNFFLDAWLVYVTDCCVGVVVRLVSQCLTACVHVN